MAQMSAKEQVQALRRLAREWRGLCGKQATLAEVKNFICRMSDYRPLLEKLRIKRGLDPVVQATCVEQHLFPILEAARAQRRSAEPLSNVAQYHLLALANPLHPEKRSMPDEMERWADEIARMVKGGRPPKSGDTDPKLDRAIFREWNRGYARGEYVSKAVLADKLPGELKKRIPPSILSSRRDLIKYLKRAIDRARKR